MAHRRLRPDERRSGFCEEGEHADSPRPESLSAGLSPGSCARGASAEQQAAAEGLGRRWNRNGDKSERGRNLSQGDRYQAGDRLVRRSRSQALRGFKCASKADAETLKGGGWSVLYNAVNAGRSDREMSRVLERP